MTKTSMADVKRELEEIIRNCKKEMEDRIAELQKSVEFLSAKYEESRTALSASEAENKKLREDNASLSLKCDLLSTQVTASQQRITQCEQYSRNMNLEIKGVSTCGDENLVDLLGKIGEKVGETITQSDIAKCHRVPVAKKQNEHNIVVQFAHRGKRDAVLEKARKKKLVGGDLDLEGTNPICINEHLCPELKKLLGQAVARKREVGWKFVWVRNGNIFARRAERAPLLKVFSASDLAKMT